MHAEQKTQLIHNESKATHGACNVRQNDLILQLVRKVGTCQCYRDMQTESKAKDGRAARVGVRGRYTAKNRSRWHCLVAASCADTPDWD